MSDFYSKLINIQSNLNAPKGQFNKFGKYKYRSCEDIMSALKPLLAEQGLFQSITDEIIQVGDRFYVKSTVTVTDGKESLSVSAMARESLTKKGMDDSQVTGATSSYARKYALNGMYNIDDSKDADTNEFKSQSKVKQATITDLQNAITTAGYTVEQCCKTWGVNSLNEIKDINSTIQNVRSWK